MGPETARLELSKFDPVLGFAEFITFTNATIKTFYEDCKSRRQAQEAYLRQRRDY